jgi:hypothetical protein
MRSRKAPEGAMTDETPLADALRRMQSRLDDATPRLRFHSELLAAELYVLLTEEVRGDRLSPRVFDLEAGRAVLAFDGEARMADFAGRAVAYAAVPGRVLVAMLVEAREGLSLIVHAGDKLAELLPPATLDWLAATLTAPPPVEAEAVADAFGPPALGEAALDLLVPALERRLSGIPGLQAAVLARVHWQGSADGHVLALAGVAEPARPALARAVAEALELSGLDEGALDVVFPPFAAMARIAAVGRHLAPAPVVPPEPSPGLNAGLDPTRPPRLK